MGFSVKCFLSIPRWFLCILRWLLYLLRRLLYIFKRLHRELRERYIELKYHKSLRCVVIVYVDPRYIQDAGNCIYVQSNARPNCYLTNCVSFSQVQLYKFIWDSGMVTLTWIYPAFPVWTLTSEGTSHRPKINRSFVGNNSS